MWRKLQRIWGLGLLIFFSQFAAGAQQIEVFEDVQGIATIEQVLANPAWFEKTDQVSPGFSDSTYWLRVKLSNESNQPREQVIQFHSHALSEVTAYRQLAGQLERFRSGTRVPLDQRPMPGTLLNFPFEMPSNANHWIYFKVANEFKIALGHSILSPVQAIDKNTKFVWTNALIARAILVLFIYNALIASATASRLYVAYSLFLLASLVTFLVSSRLTEQWGWLIDRHSTGYTALAFFAFSFWFMDELFKDKLTRLSRLCSWLGILLLLGHPVLPAPQMIQMMAGVTVPIIFVLLGTKIGSAWRQGHRLAPYVALGWFLYIASNILTLLSAQGQLPPEFASGYAVGNLLEGLVFSAVLALRLRQQDQENQSLIHDLNKTLKHDNLTGLLNRTGIQIWLGQNAMTYVAYGPVTSNLSKAFGMRAQWTPLTCRPSKEEVALLGI